jgi:hypothetical protein
MEVCLVEKPVFWAKNSWLARPQATFYGQDLYPGLFCKAGALMKSLL